MLECTLGLVRINCARLDGCVYCEHYQDKSPRHDYQIDATLIFRTDDPETNFQTTREFAIAIYYKHDEAEARQLFDQSMRQRQEQDYHFTGACTGKDLVTITNVRIHEI